MNHIVIVMALRGGMGDQHLTQAIRRGIPGQRVLPFAAQSFHDGGVASHVMLMCDVECGADALVKSISEAIRFVSAGSAAFLVQATPTDGMTWALANEGGPLLEEQVDIKRTVWDRFVAGGDGLTPTGNQS